MEINIYDFTRKFMSIDESIKKAYKGGDMESIENIVSKDCFIMAPIYSKDI